MDVGDPSNFIRILELLHHEFSGLRNLMSSYSVSDNETRETLKNVFDNEHYLADPHGAVAYFALKEYLQQHPGQAGMFLETAHPVKFYDVVEPVIGEVIPIPELLKPLMEKEKKSILMEADFQQLSEFLINR
jgi:threonine synthase